MRAFEPLEHHAPARSYLLSFVRYAGPRAWISLVLTILLGLTEGVGLVMLVPFLQLIGFDGAEKSDGFTVLVRGLFERIGLPLTLPAVLCAYVVVVGIRAFAGRYQEVLNAGLIQGFTRFLQDRLYGALARVEWLSFIRVSGADVLRVLTGDLPRVGFATRQLLQLIGTAVITMIYIGVALSLSIAMTLFALACGAVLFFLLQPHNRQAHRCGEALQATVRDMYLAASEHLGGMKIAKSYGLEQEHARRFFAVTGRIASQYIHFSEVSAATRMYHQIGATAALSAFFYVATRFLAMPPASLLLMVFLFARLLPRFSGMQQYMQQIGNSIPAYRAAMFMQSRLEAACEAVPPSPVQTLRLQSAIRFSRVSFSYDGSDVSEGRRVLREIDLVIPADKTIAVVGPSGSGKTTLADLLMGLLIPAVGTIFIDEEPLTGDLVHQWRSSIGYVPQETFLFHDTVRANLLWARPEAAEEELWDALRLAAAEPFVSALPKGLDTVLGDRGIRLSGGERQRLALARALLRKPTLLLLDEATSSLDTENERRIQDAVEGLQGELTMVVIAHRLSTIRRADGIVVLEGGRVVETGTWEELSRAKGGRFLALLGQDG